VIDAARTATGHTHALTVLADAIAAGAIAADTAAALVVVITLAVDTFAPREGRTDAAQSQYAAKGGSDDGFEGLTARG
jgi:hypothetical protein